jgi:hypothetical protein
VGNHRRADLVVHMGLTRRSFVAGLIAAPAIGYLIGKPKRTPAGFLIAQVALNQQGVINMIVHNSAKRMQIGETMYAHNEIRSIPSEAQEKEDTVTIIGPRQTARRSDDA